MKRIVMAASVFALFAAGLAAQQAPEGFVRIPGGTFTMGSPASEPERGDNEAQHRVTVSGFLMAKYEVTQREYEAIMGNNPSHFKGPNLPVEAVRWYEAVEYCNKRSQRDGLAPAYTIDKTRKDPNNQHEADTLKWTVTWNRNANGYRLPTEAEWEYACRAGTTTVFYTGNQITTHQANYRGSDPYNGGEKGPYREKTMPVGSYPPNPWGLYDMHGNVAEWCWDWYGDYPASAQTDPVGGVSSARASARGGRWNYMASSVCSARRFSFRKDGRLSSIGFRVVRQ